MAHWAGNLAIFLLVGLCSFLATKLQQNKFGPVVFVVKLVQVFRWWSVVQSQKAGEKNWEEVSRIVAFWRFIRIELTLLKGVRNSPGSILAENSWLCRILCMCGKAKEKVGKSRSVHASLAFQEFLENPGKPGDNFPHFPGFSLSAKKPWPSNSDLALLTPPWFRGFLEKPRIIFQAFWTFPFQKSLVLLQT